MSQTLAALVGGMPAAGMSLQDILDKAAPGLGFLPAFLRTWFKVDISQAVGLISLMGVMSNGFDFLNRVAVKLYWWVTRFCTASVSIAATDRLNREVLNWLGATVLTRQGTRILAARSETISNDSWGWNLVTERDDFHNERRRPVEYLPTFGTTWFFHRMRLFVVRRVPSTRGIGPRLPGGETPDEYAAAPDGNEPLVVMCLGRSVDPIKKFLEDCRDFSDHQREECITIRACKGQYHSWTWDTTILRPIRPIETVHFDEKIKADLVRDVVNYLQPETRRFYHQRGIPYRRGYLLHGPPGTGKTSLSLALAGIFGLELYLLHIPSMSSDKEMETLFTSLPPRCIVLLEDIDAVGIKRKNMSNGDDDDDGVGEDDDEEDEDLASSRASSRTTLSGLLNVLDGVASQEGRIVLMTSNMADKLDPALVRPGRIDKSIYLGNINQESARLMFRRMYRSSFGEPAGGTADAEVDVENKAGSSSRGNSEDCGDSTSAVKDAELGLPAPQPGNDGREGSSSSTDVDVAPEVLEQLAAEFAGKIPENTFTPAMLQGFLLSHRVDPVGAARNITAWVETETRLLEEARALAKKQRERRARKRKERQLRALAKLAEASSAAASSDSVAPSPKSPTDSKSKSNDTEGCTVNGGATTAAAASTAPREPQSAGSATSTTVNGQEARGVESAPRPAAEAETTADEAGRGQGTTNTASDTQFAAATAKTNGTKTPVNGQLDEGEVAA